MYIALKHSHVTLVFISLVLFFGRFYWHKIKNNPLPKVLKVLPHVIDTLLLLTAAWLCVVIEQYPLVHTWLTLKVGFVIAYIVLAFKAMKAESRNRAVLFMTFAAISVLMAAKVAIGKGVM